MELSYLIYLVIVVAVGLLVGVFTVLVKRIAALQSRQEEHQLQLTAVQEQLLVSQQALKEIRVGSIGMGNKIKDLVATVQQTANQQQQLANQDPQSRLYHQAAKLVASGYSVEELMHECDMPKAEAELLFNLHKR